MVCAGGCIDSCWAMLLLLAATAVLVRALARLLIMIIESAAECFQSTTSCAGHCHAAYTAQLCASCGHDSCVLLVVMTSCDCAGVLIQQLVTRRAAAIQQLVTRRATAKACPAFP
jgi:hypothetical protein